MWRDIPEPVERMFDSPKPGQNIFWQKTLVRMFLVGQKREKTALYANKQTGNNFAVEDIL